MKRIAIMLTLPMVVACGASQSTRAETLDELQRRIAKAEKSKERLAQQNEKKTQRIRELETQLGLARAEAEDLRDARYRQRKTVTISEDEGSKSGSGSSQGGGAADSAPRRERSAAPAREGGGSRPMLRLYGGGSEDAGSSEGEGRMPSTPSVPEGVPEKLPVAPVPDSPTASGRGERSSEDAQDPASADRSASHGASSRPGASSPVVAEYRRALRMVRDRRFASALEAFGRFIERHPEHPYTDNAVYWRGEVNYAKRRYGRALEAFERVIERYPDGNKVADALLKIGLCHKRMGDLSSARTAFRRLREQFPDTVAARVASREDAS